MSILGAWARPRVDILVGDVREILPTLATESFDCCVTSPPYFGLRDYGVDGQIGLEATLDAYLQELVSVFREVRRVLKPAGTFWLNIGDSYAGSGRGGNPHAGSKQGTNRGSQSVGVLYGREGEERDAERDRIKIGNKALVSAGFKPKDLLLVPARLALALQTDGWWVRSEIVWAKPNPMPESVTDRPTSAHEKIWLLTKSEKYYFDQEAVRENIADSQVGRVRADRIGGKSHKERGQHSEGGMYQSGKQQAIADNSNPSTARRLGGFNERWDRAEADGLVKTGRNIRNVWTITPKPYKGAHFATFPPELTEKCIKAGCPVGGHVFDPFGGAGTSGLVAKQLRRNATLVELNPEYAAMARRRIDAS